MNGWQYTMNFAVMPSIYYKDGCHPQKCFLNRRLPSSKARTATGPNLSLKSCARLRPSQLIILIPSQVRIVILQQIKQRCQKGYEIQQLQTSQGSRACLHHGAHPNNKDWALLQKHKLLEHLPVPAPMAHDESQYYTACFLFVFSHLLFFSQKKMSIHPDT